VEGALVTYRDPGEGRARTLLEQRIAEMRMTLEEFAEYAERFGREHNEPGTLSVRHLQRLVSGRRGDGRPLGSLRPATARLLERICGDSITDLLAPPPPAHKPAGTLLSVAALSAVNVNVARELAASISGGDAGPLAQVQTTYDIDRAIASAVDSGTKNVLCRWAVGLDSPIARVNATGILAKLPGQSESDKIVAFLGRDGEVRRLYLTAVTARVCVVYWDQAAEFIQNPAGSPFASIAAERFAREVMNPADAGARWCSAKMLQDLSPAIGR